MKRYIWVFGLLFTALVISSSGNTDKNADSTPSDEAQQSETITVEHELDTTDVPKNPKNIAVFDFGILDTLDQLGIDVAGVPQATIPKYLEKYAGSEYENLGSLKEPDFDKMASMDLDLIIISGRQSTLYDQLSEIAPTIYLDLDPTNYMESFRNNMHIIGQIFNKEAEVDSELAAIDESIASLQEKAKEKSQKALIILANDDKISAYGTNSRFGIIHDVFGIPAIDENIEASTHGKNVSFEYVMEHNPDILYVIDRGAAIGEKSSAKQIVENKLVMKTKAYEQDQINYLDPDFWYLSGGGLVSVKEMISEIDASLK